MTPICIAIEHASPAEQRQPPLVARRGRSPLLIHGHPPRRDQADFTTATASREDDSPYECAPQQADGWGRERTGDDDTTCRPAQSSGTTSPKHHQTTTTADCRHTPLHREAPEPAHAGPDWARHPTAPVASHHFPWELGRPPPSWSIQDHRRRRLPRCRRNNNAITPLPNDIGPRRAHNARGRKGPAAAYNIEGISQEGALADKGLTYQCLRIVD
jgi:hypothetical protein